ncbi:MAG: hypothetical protein ACLQGP_21210 [Isosphaeraceae bacterium]
MLRLDQLRTELHFFGGHLPAIAATATVLAAAESAAATVLATAATVLAAEPAAATVLAASTTLAAATTTALRVIRVPVPATATLAPLAILTTLSDLAITTLAITTLPWSTRSLARSTRIHPGANRPLTFIVGIDEALDLRLLRLCEL